MIDEKVSMFNSLINLEDDKRGKDVHKVQHMR